jgi:hypothetical protein
MATQGYGTAPGRNSMNAVGTSLPRSVTTKPVPIILSEMKKQPQVKGPSK